MRIMRWLRRERVTAIHDDDLEKLLTRIGALEDVLAGKCHCVHCHSTISVENLGAISLGNGLVAFVCDQVSCIASLRPKREDDYA